MNAHAPPSRRRARRRRGAVLTAGAAALAIAQDRMLDQLEQALGGYERIARHAVSAEGAAMIVAEAEES